MGGSGAVGIMGTTVACAVLAPVVLPMAGFTSIGISAGSLAAYMQGTAVAAGSAFAIAQSAGALGAATSATVGAKVGLVAGISAFATGAAGVTTWVASNGLIKKLRKIN